MKLELTPDLSNVEKLIKAYPKITAQTINRLAKTERTLLSRLITTYYTIKKSDVDKFIRVGPPAHEGKLYTQITAYSETLIPWAKFKYRATKSGVNVTIIKGRVISIKGAFVATVGSGHTGVFSRVNQLLKPRDTRKEVRDATPYFYYTELPIEERVGPSVATMASRRQNTEAIMADWSKNFEEELLRRVSYE